MGELQGKSGQEVTPRAPLPIGVAVEGTGVVLEGVAPGLLDYVAHLGAIHQLLFGKPLVITSARDGQHAPGSLHAQGRAIDIRTRDLEVESELLWFTILAYYAPVSSVAVFDERALPGAPHIHLEWHGS